MDKLKVLYVDDEELNLQLFEINLSEIFNVITADSGEHGLEIILKEKDIAVVVSDMKMPSMNGIEFIKKAKEVDPTIQYYILTGFEITEEIRDALKTGLIKKYFRKPFDLDIIKGELLNAIK